jgi:DNA-binding NarL/FixJ family response regulator
MPPQPVLDRIAHRPHRAHPAGRAPSTATPGSSCTPGHREHVLLQRALDVGARRFVLEDALLANLTAAITAVADGDTYVDPELADALAAAGAHAPLQALTKRKRQILGLLSDGLTNERVATQLSISPETVQWHVRNAMTTLDADTQTQAVATAIRQAIIG